MSNARDKANIPSLNFSSTGIDDNATSTAITIDSSQNVGINTSSPSLASGNGIVISGGSSVARLELRNTTSGTTSSDGAFLTYSANDLFLGNRESGNSLFYTNNAERMRITSAGVVGIGAIPPTGTSSSSYSQLEVGNSFVSDSEGINSSFQLLQNAYVGSGNNNYAVVGSGASHSNRIMMTSGVTSFSRAYPVTADSQITYNESMRIDSSGRVGIGTSSPSSLFHIYSSSPQMIIQDSGTHGTDSTPGLVFKDTSSSQGEIGFENSGEMFIRQLKNSDMTFRTNNTERMRIYSSGLVAINTTSPDAGSIVSVNHEGSSFYGLSLNSTTTSGTQYHLRFARGGAGAGYIASNSATTVTLNNTSDERLKENVQNSNSAIQDLKDIQVRQFDWKDNIDTHRDFGFVAQELVNVVPEAVTQGTDELDDNGKPVRSWGVDYSHIVPRLVKVCQEQQTKIEELEARITALETNQP
jgi:hypothetical protein